MTTMEREGYGHAAPALPEDKAGLLAAVPGEAVAQSFAYLRVLYEACWAIRRTQFHPAFANQWWNRELRKDVENLQTEEDRFFSDVMVPIFQGYPSIFRGADDKFEKALERFISFLASGSGPLSQREIEGIGAYCGELLWLCQKLPSQWGEIVRIKDGKVVGQLPGWLKVFGVLGESMERKVKEQRKLYSAQEQSILVSLGDIASTTYREIRGYYSQQPRDRLAPAVNVLLSAWFPMTHLVAISPAVGESAPWAELKRRLIDHSAYIKAKGGALGDEDKRSAAAAAFFAAAARAVVNEDGVKELMGFQTVWLAYGKMLENIVKTFQINPAAKTRTELILDLQDAREYWFEVKGFVQSLPNLKPIERTVEVSELV